MPKRPKAAYAHTSPLRIFGERIRALRLARGWSQEKLAGLADRHLTYVSSIERAERNVTVLTIHRLADALGVDPGVLLTRDAGHIGREVRRLRGLARK
ncbi:MAG: helix-turn-helix domain-containing protein [Planctomycetes bacterium]|nr:helix-turn-helix domain-containing protein [Planctomycetota bacterium]